MQVPFHRPSIDREEIDEVVDTLRSGWLTTGPKTARFEEEFGRYIGVPEAQAVNSCTAGLHLALAALDIGPGDEVITTPLTFCATVNVILHVGATPVLADVGDDGNISASSIEARITRKTRAILPVHLAGLPCEMKEIWEIARRYGLHVIEDSAHAVGSHYFGVPIGADNPLHGGHSKANVYSFYATKNLTTGEGGMVTSHDQEFIETVKTLCLHGISRSAWNRYSDKGNWYYEVLRPGFKYNLTDIQSAIGIHQLAKLESFLQERSRQASFYNDQFAGVKEVELPPMKDYCRHAWHLYMLRLNLDKLEITRAQFIQELKEKGVGTSVHFIPIPIHPAYSEIAARPENACPKALDLYPRLVSLPLFPGMTVEQQAYVVKSVKGVVQSTRKAKLVLV
jgi:dTDP-4-amino-4,6-dideoxygalactose transaminase